MTYVPEEVKVVYKSKDRKQGKIFNALEWIAPMCSHVPNKGEQMVRYYGFYSNVSRGKRKKRDSDELIASILDELVKSQQAPVIVIPVKTGIQKNQSRGGGRLPLPDRSRGQPSRD